VLANVAIIRRQHIKDIYGDLVNFFRIYV